MATAIKIESPEISKATAENLSTGIIHILQAGSQYHTPQDVMMQALGVFRDTITQSSRQNASINNCNFSDVDKQMI